MNELPPPNDPSFSVSPTEDEFYNPKGDEDAALLATGAWADQAQEATRDAPGRSVHIHIHKRG